MGKWGNGRKNSGSRIRSSELPIRERLVEYLLVHRIGRIGLLDVDGFHDAFAGPSLEGGIGPIAVSEPLHAGFGAVVGAVLAEGRVVQFPVHGRDFLLRALETVGAGARGARPAVAHFCLGVFVQSGENGEAAADDPDVDFGHAGAKATRHVKVMIVKGSAGSALTSRGKLASTRTSYPANGRL